MRWLLMLCIFACFSLQAFGAKRLTIDQLRQMLENADRAHRTDADLARQISDSELSQRLTSPTLEKLGKRYEGHPQVGIALQLLADQSTFLDPPVDELPKLAPLSSTDQQRQLEAAHAFVLKTLPNLPNLLATKTTFNFDNSPQVLPKGGWAERDGLHLVGQSKSEVSVRNESENASTLTKPAQTQASGGLISWGEFGSTLFIVLGDTASGTIAWDHWEQGATGLVSVFHYDVPKSASHYELVMPTRRTRAMTGTDRWMGTAGVLQNSSTTVMVHSKPAYHGSLWVDPGSGAVLGVTVVADLKGDNTLQRGAILVEYGSVQIASTTFICPTRSLALSAAAANVKSTMEGQTTLWLNENLFSDYHRFASTSRILNESASNSGPLRTESGSSESPYREQTAIPAQPVPASSLASEADKTQTISPPPQEQTAAEAGSNIDTSEAAKIPSPASQELRPPDTTPSAAPPASTAVVPEPLRLDVDAVLVPVIVRGQDGLSVDGLTKEDFAIFDDGKQKALTGFTVERQSANQNKTIGLPDRVTVFLFDDMHLSVAEIVPAQKAVLKALDGALTGANVAAVVSSSGKVNSGLTNDRQKLSRAVMAVQPHGIYRLDSGECPRIGYYQADLIRRHSMEAVNDALKQVMLRCNPNLPSDMAENIVEQSARRVLAVSEQDVMTTYASTSEFVRRMARLPGQHRLILVSTGFLPIEEEARAAESTLINLAIQSNVAISALDARGLYTSALTASDNIANQDPSQVGSYLLTELRLAENAMAELADGTGGDFFHDNNDLDSGMKMLVAQPETMYVLQFRPDRSKGDGVLHKLSVKVDRDVKVQARRSYFETSKKTSH
ncbi:MAG: VWA domain-containing protein [Acidobacteria bacterium]|nr:VWA domain-containing protein [Acidobacteriota bacterium]